MKIAVFVAVLLAVSAVPVFAEMNEEQMSLFSMFSANDKPMIEDRYGPCCFIMKWVNDDIDGHTVTSVDGVFDSGEMKKGESFAVTFDKPGKYEYYSKLFPNYIYKIHVYDPETECNPSGCGLAEHDVSFAEMDPDLKNKAKILQQELREINKQINQLDSEVSNPKYDSDEYNKKFNLLTELREKADGLYEQLHILEKNDPNCISLDKQSECMYEIKTVQENFNGPEWISKIFSWNEQGLMSDDEVITTLKWLIKNNVISQ